MSDENYMNESEEQLKGTVEMEEQPMDSTAKGMSIASLILGIVSIVCCCAYYIGITFSIVGLILGILAKKRITGKSSLALAGIITSSIGLAVSVIWLIIMIVAIVAGNTAGIDFNDPQAVSEWLQEWLGNLKKS